MERTPYSVEPCGENKYPRRLGPNSFLLRSKYIFVYQEVRGRYMSEGKFEEMAPHKSDSAGNRSEGSDTNDTVEWLLAGGLTLIGPLTAELYVSISATNADFVVKLIDVLPGGEPNTTAGFQRLVRAEVMRGKFRDSFSNPQPFKPGEITKVGFAMPDVAPILSKKATA
ncbi:MAG: hypothetical protein KDD27_13735 [Saprospiraceae bacterium]|nr:hypothetical protein [Saprospiraceae bacterium]